MRDYSLNRHALRFNGEGRFSLAVELRQEAVSYWSVWKAIRVTQALGGAGCDILGEVGERATDQDQQPP